MLVKLHEFWTDGEIRPFLVNLDRVRQAQADRVYHADKPDPTPATRLDLLPVDAETSGRSVWVAETLDQILVAQDYPSGVLTNPELAP